MLGNLASYGYPVPVNPIPLDRNTVLSPDGSVAAIAAGVRAGSLDPVEVLERCLRRIEERDEELRAFVAVRSEAARSEARVLRRHPDLASLRLAGVPVAVKDILTVEGLPARLGSAAVRGAPSAASAEVVLRLRGAGAIVVGLTTLPELAVWATTDGPRGVTRNPRQPGRTPGGSSGGSAAAVGAGLVPLAIGTDGLGSIRIPGAACGIPGLKPTHGLVPEEALGGDWHAMTATGPLASDVAGVALATAVMAGRPALGSADVSRPLLIALSSRTPLPAGEVDPGGRLRWSGSERHWRGPVTTSSRTTRPILRSTRSPCSRAGSVASPRPRMRWAPTSSQACSSAGRARTSAWAASFTDWGVPGRV